MLHFLTAKVEVQQAIRLIGKLVSDKVEILLLKGSKHPPSTEQIESSLNHQSISIFKFQIYFYLLDNVKRTREHSSPKAKI